jgi:hypothetical protein
MSAFFCARGAGFLSLLVVGLGRLLSWVASWGAAVTVGLASLLVLSGRSEAARDSLLPTADGRLRLSIVTVLGKVSWKASFCANGLNRACCWALVAVSQTVIVLLLPPAELPISDLALLEEVGPEGRSSDLWLDAR